jgi:hypothetical protein
MKRFYKAILRWITADFAQLQHVHVRVFTVRGRSSNTFIIFVVFPDLIETSESVLSFRSPSSSLDRWNKWALRRSRLSSWRFFAETTTWFRRIISDSSQDDWEITCADFFLHKPISDWLIFRASQRRRNFIFQLIRTWFWISLGELIITRIRPVETALWVRWYWSYRKLDMEFLYSDLRLWVSRRERKRERARKFMYSFIENLFLIIIIRIQEYQHVTFSSIFWLYLPDKKEVEGEQ